MEENPKRIPGHHTPTDRLRMDGGEHIASPEIEKAHEQPETRWRQQNAAQHVEVAPPELQKSRQQAALQSRNGEGQHKEHAHNPRARGRRCGKTCQHKSLASPEQESESCREKE